MGLLYFWRGLLLGATGLLAATAAAQAVPDTAPARPAPWLVKGGLRLTHLSYSRNATSWQLLMPLALGVERRLGSRVGLYAQLDADTQLTSAATRRRRRSTAGADARLPSAALGLGTRYYYGRPATPTAGRAAPEFGKYLALEAGATLASTTTQVVGAGRGLVGSRSVVVPSLYALWGIQNRLRPHLLYDLSAGLGVLAPARTQAEYLLASHGWDVGAQVNVRLYLAN